MTPMALLMLVATTMATIALGSEDVSGLESLGTPIHHFNQTDPKVHSKKMMPHIQACHGLAEGDNCSFTGYSGQKVSDTCHTCKKKNILVCGKKPKKMYGGKGKGKSMNKKGMFGDIHGKGKGDKGKDHAMHHGKVKGKKDHAMHHGKVKGKKDHAMHHGKVKGKKDHAMHHGKGKGKQDHAKHDQVPESALDRVRDASGFWEHGDEGMEDEERPSRDQHIHMPAPRHLVGGLLLAVVLLLVAHACRKDRVVTAAELPPYVAVSEPATHASVVLEGPISKDVIHHGYVKTSNYEPVAQV